jgi:hypothetical protein
VSTTTPAEPTVAELARLKRRRGWLVILLAVALLLSLVLPHVSLRNVHEPGRSLLLTGFYFLHVQPAEFHAPVNVPQLGFGFNVLYVGLGMHEFGLLLSAATFWSIWPHEINRWIYRMLVIGGWLLLLSTPWVIWGWFLIDTAGVPASLGVAWIPLLVSGVIMTLAARRAKLRIDDTWYEARPELM